MNTQLVATADGSHTLFNPAFEAHYHSVHGALQESQHIFIELGLKPALVAAESPLYVFEMGFGTGLNALLTYIEATRHQKPVYYVSLEAYPVLYSQAQQLNYGQVLDSELFLSLHESPWDSPVVLSPYFTLEKHHTLLQNFETSHRFGVVYYDAFAPAAQPELWTQEVFEKIASWLNPNAHLTTYCSKGYVQRNLKAAGFRIQKHPGPGRKREVLRAILCN